MVFANTVRVTSIITGGGGGGLQNPSDGLVQFMFFALAWYGPVDSGNEAARAHESRDVVGTAFGTVKLSMTDAVFRGQR